ncbi:MAG: hypothetical protein ACTSWJ_08715 [Candidatus Heimdallarchaeaceae archaeon]
MNPEEREEKEIKNLKNRMIDYIRKADLIVTVKIAILTGMKVPKKVLMKFISKQSGQ